MTPDAPHAGDTLAADDAGQADAAGVSLRTLPVAAWALYDFANSIYPAVITTAVFSVYFAKVVVGNEQGLGDLW